MVAKIRGEAVAAPQTSRDTMFQINNTLEATDTDTDGPHTHVHLPPVSSLSTASDVTQPVARAPGTSYNNPFSVEGLQELHDKMDQLTRRVNYHGVELEAALSVSIHRPNIPRNPPQPFHASAPSRLRLAARLSLHPSHYVAQFLRSVKVLEKTNIY